MASLSAHRQYSRRPSQDRTLLVVLLDCRVSAASVDVSVLLLHQVQASYRFWEIGMTLSPQASPFAPNSTGPGLLAPSPSSPAQAQHSVPVYSARNRASQHMQEEEIQLR